MLMLPKIVLLIPIVFSAPLLATQENTCALTYEGVIGNGDQAIAIIKQSNGSSLYLKKGTSIRCRNYVVSSIKRNEVVLKNSQGSLILNSQGTQVAGSTPPRYREPDSARTAMGGGFVDSGSVTPDDVNEAIAKDQENYEDLMRSNGSMYFDE